VAGPRVKICGITNLQDAQRAADLGAWALGLIFYPRSRRRCRRDDAAAISAALRRRTELCGVFVNATLAHVTATADACRTVIGTRLNAPEHERQVLRCLRVGYFSGGMLDDRQMIDEAVETAGLDPNEVHGWTQEEATEEAFREDMAKAREPLPAASALDHKLANWSGGRRYTCPSYEIERLEDGVRIAVPGFQPFATYDVVLANLIPGLERRDPPDDVVDVLTWAGTPLASQEVATVMDISLPEAREHLGKVAEERHAGADGFWTLPG